jgi:hypothetical protein
MVGIRDFPSIDQPMLMDGLARPLQIEVLINSPGPHDQVRVREPFGALQRQGVDCRLHERPFRFSQCIRPHSLVIWQWEHLQWLRERGCLLLTEWDDHPDLFPPTVGQQLEATAMAPLELCHAIHTSSGQLFHHFWSINPLAVVLDNQVAHIPALNLDKHQSQTVRVFIGNQNREGEHRHLQSELSQWLRHTPELELVIVGDPQLATNLASTQVRSYGRLSYRRYRELMRSCHIALLPLRTKRANACKTPIKWLECAAESVAVIAGPELYGQVLGGAHEGLVDSLDAVVPRARILAQDLATRCHQVMAAHGRIRGQWSLQQHLPYRLWLYQQLWRRRLDVDAVTVRRLQRLGTLPPMETSDFQA